MLYEKETICLILHSSSLYNWSSSISSGFSVTFLDFTKICMYPIFCVFFIYSMDSPSNRIKFTRLILILSSSHIHHNSSQYDSYLFLFLYYSSPTVLVSCLSYQIISFSLINSFLLSLSFLLLLLLDSVFEFTRSLYLFEFIFRAPI